MLESCWVRVDDRLIHGQVTVGWRQHLRYDQIWVVDDGAATDPLLRDVLHLSAPSGVEVVVLGIEDAARALAKRAGKEPGRWLLLLKSPVSAMALVERGVPLTRLNIGNVAAAPGSRRVHKTVSLTAEQGAALDALADRGIEISFQQTPDDVAVDWHVARRRV